MSYMCLCACKHMCMGVDPHCKENTGLGLQNFPKMVPYFRDVCKLHARGTIYMSIVVRIGKVRCLVGVYL